MCYTIETLLNKHAKEHQVSFSGCEMCYTIETNISIVLKILKNGFSGCEMCYTIETKRIRRRRRDLRDVSVAAKCVTLLKRKAL